MNIFEAIMNYSRLSALKIDQHKRQIDIINNIENQSKLCDSQTIVNFLTRLHTHGAQETINALKEGVSVARIEDNLKKRDVLLSTLSNMLTLGTVCRDIKNVELWNIEENRK